MNHRRSDPAKPERLMKGLPFGQNPQISPYMLAAGGGRGYNGWGDSESAG
jgi:hypothetical protein